MKKIIVYSWLLLMLCGGSNLWAAGSIMVDNVSIGVPSNENGKGMIYYKISNITVTPATPSSSQRWTRYLTGKVPFSQLCDKDPNNKYENKSGKYNIEVKLYHYGSPLDSYFDRQVFVGMGEVQGTTPGQFVQGTMSSEVAFKIALTLKDNLYYQMSERVEANKPIIIMSMFCRNNANNGSISTSQSQHHVKFTAFRVITQDPVVLNQTCTMIDENQTVNLRKVLLTEFDSNQLVYGGSFQIKLNCSQAAINDAIITFSDDTLRQNLEGLGLQYSEQQYDYLPPTSQSMSDSSLAKYISLKIKDTEDGQWLTFNPLPAGNWTIYDKSAYSGSSKPNPYMKSFGQNLANQGVFSHNYEVYYYNYPRSKPTVGKVKRIVKYKIYYH